MQCVSESASIQSRLSDNSDEFVLPSARDLIVLKSRDHELK